MIKDSVFKKLPHKHKSYKMISNGGEIEVGYKPDYVLKNKKNDFVILECEYCSNRKTFIGGLLKAAHFLQNEKTGILVFVIKKMENTKCESIAAQLKTYFKWIKSITNLRKVYVIDADKYYKEEPMEICGYEFNKSALSV